MRSPVQIWVAAPKSRWNQLIPAGFPLLSQLFRRVYFCGFSLTHTVTHTPKCPERDRERQTGSSAFLPGVLCHIAILLLDWSENAMVALAFATQFHNDSHTGHDAIVWCLNPILLNSHIRFPEYDSEPIPNICDNNELQTMFESPRQDYPVAIIGPQNTDRIIAQRGVFTLFPNKDSFTMESLSSAEKFLVKIVIPESDIKPISES